MRTPVIFRIFKQGQLVGVKQFDQDQIVVGHSAEVHLDLDSDQVSQIHCLVERRDSGYYICDLGSGTGTFKNGQAILDELISSGDEVEIGPFKVVFFVGVPKPKAVPGAAAPIPEAPPARVESSSMPPAAVVKKEEVIVEMPAPVETPVPVEVHASPVDVPAATVVQPPPVEVPTVPVAQPVRPTPSIPPQAPESISAAAEVRPASIPTSVPPIKEEKKSLPTAEVKESPKVTDEKPPVIVSNAIRPEIRQEKNQYKKEKKSKTFAPPSEIRDLKSYLNIGKGNTLEVVVAWRERVITTYHFSGKNNIRVNAGGESRIALPPDLVPKSFLLIEMNGLVKVNLAPGMTCERVGSQGEREGMQNVSSLRVEQGELICLHLPGGNMSLYLRYVPNPPIVPMLPVILSSSEMMGVVASVVMVAMLAFYISATTPKDWEEEEQEDVQRIAQVVFNKPPTPAPPVPTPPPPTPPPVPTPKVPPPTPTPPKKVVVADEKKEAQKKGPQKPAAKAQVAARASEVAPKPNAKDRTKRFTSTRQGGAIRTGEKAGANAASANKDLSKVGLFSAFGGGGSRANIDKAYTGAGEVLGMADKATGTSGFNEDRAGDDLGSRFKDAGAGGKGTATQGIAGIGTKGRGSGQAAYGATEGFGSKTTVNVEPGGAEESFDPKIDKEAIRRVIRAKLHEVRSCYERVLNTLAKGSTLEGKVVYGWEIIERGQARNVKLKSSTLGNAKVEACIRDRLASWTFPEPPKDMIAEVEAYPFILKSN